MKKVILPIFVLAMLLALVGSASAGGTPEGITFRIDGHHIGDPLVPEGCKLKFRDLEAVGSVSEDLEGSFTYVEKGKINFCTLPPSGSNKGVMTIVTNDDEDTLVIEFKGQTDLLFVWGVWKLKSATGDYAGFKGAGTYSGYTYFKVGSPLPYFEVTFVGSFYPD